MFNLLYVFIQFATLRILEQIKHDTRIDSKRFSFKQMGYYTGLWRAYIL